jgi:AcrR family transcriptional regulator
MAQVLKDDVRERIAGAALEVFAARGYLGATMGEIAAAAGISTGNVYRYFPGKNELFDAVVSPAFARRFRALVRGRVRALRGVRDVDALGAGAPYRLAAEELLRFSIEHRLGVIVLLDRAEGSRHHGFAERTVEDLVRLATAHFRALDPGLAPSRSARFVLAEIYRGWVRTLVRILERFETEPAIRGAVAAYTRYHLTGLQSFFAGERR